jgi:hypothetical protein
LPSLRNSASSLRYCGFLVVAMALGGCWSDTNLTSQTFPHGLSSFSVTVQDLSGELGSFPLSTVEFRITAQALDEDGNPFPFNGPTFVYVTPGNIMQTQYNQALTPADDPVLTFVNGQATGDFWALHVYGDTDIWVENRTVNDAGPGGYATGVADLEYGYPLLAELQVTSDNTVDPLENDYVILDETKTRCFAPDGGGGSPPVPMVEDGGYCPPAQQYNMDLLVTAVQSDGFYVMDLNSYHMDLDAGYMVPNPGYDPSTLAYDLPGSWAYLFVYNYSAPELFLGNRLVTLSGIISEFDADTQLDYPAWTVNSDPVFANPQPQDIPPPVPIDPNWCSIGGAPAINSDIYLCGPSTADEHFESLESGLVIARNVTMPSRWLDCNLTGTGDVPYQPTTGCLPTTNSTFCGPNETLAQCPAGQDCIASECSVQCQSAADCNAQDQEACIDGHCQNACLCRAYCDSILDCTEESEYNSYGQYDAYIPGQQNPDGTTHTPWKISFQTRNGAPGLDPQNSPGMVLDIVGMLNQVRASDPMWEVIPRLESDICCHQDANLCNLDAGVTVPICPQPSSSQ